MQQRLMFTALILLATGITHPIVTLAQSSEVPTAGDCLVGTPEGVFAGDRPLSRDQFAAGLDACLRPLETQLNLEQYATQAEMETTIQRQLELNRELGILSDRVDELLGEPSTPPTQTDTAPTQE
ncbi:hypothetical protein [Thermocoleostomius sinensis]|uniref:Secreted protein n=1 Tax=Thermocoleostomius sinensis A174 TaxID=2016057 RepID=A0A9E8ZBM6_9CYAN|nr:hypothetical protein [Thermocoleostomius sinensis]WAL60249.1 hypothetical protein OXH18_24300 [Thermocoleostomius sinensis A174]